VYTLPRNDTQVLDKLNWQSYSFGLYDSVNSIARYWDGFLDDKDVFLSASYLSTLEAATPERMSFYYVLVEDDKGVQGILYFQLVHFNAGVSLNYDRIGKTSSTGKLRKAMRDFLAQRINFYALICGNSAITGPHGFLFNVDIDQETQLNIVDCCLDWIKNVATSRGFDVQLIFIKDFYSRIFSHSDHYTTFPQYNEFQAQPGMTMPLRDTWHDFGDYMSDLQSKYRVRLRRARKKCEHLERRPLSKDDLLKLESQLYKYYRAIADKAVFNLSILNEKYFSVLKEKLKEKFHIYGYFEDDKLIAFYSMIENNNSLEAHFLGYEESVNREKQIYLNMLFDIIEFCIERKCGEIIFARTALEIKSSVGAEAHNMYFYLQHSKGLHNKFLPLIYNVLDPGENWVSRSPFRIQG
jgi:GNAT acetyltransferase-like protein